MLEALYLTKSKIRRELLGALFSDPQRPYYLSELARLIKTSAGNIQREIAKFVQDGLIRAEKKGNMLFYSLNPDHALFNEIQSLIVKTAGIEAFLRNMVFEQKGVALAVLYGSFAKGKEKGESDIDLLIVSDAIPKNFYAKIAGLESRFNREINPTVYSSREFSEKLRHKNSFLTDIFSGSYRILKGNLDEYRKKSA